MTAGSRRYELSSALRHKLSARAIELVYRTRQPAALFAKGEKLKLYDMAAAEIGDDPITYLEFGVHRGWSIAQIAGRFRNSDSRIFGFDSFEGLPQTWSAAMGPGHFSTGGAEPVTSDPRVSFIKGWFQNTVSEFLSKRAVAGKVLVHFDADLYSSTLFLMTSLWHYIPDYYFIFDEFTPDEIIAMFDFIESYPVNFEFFGATHDEHSRPLQVFGRLQRTAFSPENA